MKNLFYDDPATGLRIIAGLETSGHPIELEVRKIAPVDPMAVVELPPWFIVEVTGTRTPLATSCLMECLPGGIVLRPISQGARIGEVQSVDGRRFPIELPK